MFQQKPRYLENRVKWNRVNWDLTIFRIFDKDDDGLISVDELRHIMLSFGEKMTEKELDEMISEANCDKDGHIDYDGMYFLNISFG